MAATVSRRQHSVNRDRRPRRTLAGDAFSRFAIQVIRLSARLTAAGDALARPAGQTSARWLVMAVIEDTPTTVAGVARILGLTRQSVQRVADLLEGDGLAMYQDNPGHRRARLLALTSAGRTALARIQVAQASWADELGAELGEEALRQASVVLDRALASMGRRSDSAHPNGD
jgi:DNA-binding MarR family transcriptional regulator